jgi:hypothetical protein
MAEFTNGTVIIVPSVADGGLTIAWRGPDQE